ncbi:Ankyrin repeat and BTB/POZ domain-containing protein 1 [Lamellibrachia satsuma]|nr:Ankyrin repeat and BTB/POZ domain-containing protein 1 [Lamellibrachia satsuma]
MDVHNLFLSCRKGDIARVKYLVDEKEVDLGVRDSWDTTPLYYACLCGHRELVKYLLDNGARCEANTFDGERCLYGALNNDIRNLLKSYKAITPSMILRDLYSEFLRRLLGDGLYADVVFVIHGKHLSAHRCVLSARSTYFRSMFHNRWKDRRMISLTNKLVRPWAFETILQYLYTGRLQCHLEQIEDITRLARQCQLNELINELQENRKQSRPSREVHVTMVSVEQPSVLPQHLSLLVDAAVPPHLYCEAGAELPFPPEQPQIFSDVTFSVQGRQFHCHKAFFCGRSDYFKALLADWGRRTATSSDTSSQVIELQDVSVDVFVCVVEYIYQDSCDLTMENVYDVCDLLHSSDVYLLPGLKRQCATRLTQYIDTDTVMSLLCTARLYNLPRLEDHCSEFLAANIEKIVQDESFAAFVREDAASIQDRESTDSIPIIDDIRFHISSFMQTFSDMYEASEKLGLIDNFLEELGLDA